VEDHRPNQTWAPAFKKFLLEMKAAKEKAIAKGQNKRSEKTEQIFAQ